MSVPLGGLNNSNASTGMYSRSSWGGPVDPFIQVKFLNDSLGEAEDPIASLVMFEWRDRQFVGVPDEQTGVNVGFAHRCTYRPKLNHTAEPSSLR